MKIWRNGELIHHIRPVRDENGVPTLCDDSPNPMTLTRYGNFIADGYFAFDPRVLPCPLSGGVAEPHPVVRVDGVRLTEGTDYTLSWANNTAPGRGTITVTGIGNYAGIVQTSPFTVLAAGSQNASYIRGDGQSARFETNFTLNPQTDRIEETILFPATWTACAAFSARSGTGGNSWSLMVTPTTFRYDYVSSGSETSRNVLTGVQHVLAAEQNHLYWSQGTGVDATANTGFTATGGTMTLFCARYNAASGGYNNYGDFRLYSYRIWRNGALIHDLVPIIDASGNATLVDDVDSPMTLTRSGTFTAGQTEYSVDAVDPQVLCTFDPVTPRPRVTKDGQSLTEGVDFVYSWSDNTAPGTGTVHVTGIGECAGLSLSRNFEIRKFWYDPIPHLDGDGVGSFIDTDCYLKPQTDTIELDFMLLGAVTSTKTIFSARAADGSNNWTFRIESPDTLSYACNSSGTADRRANAGFAVGVRYTVTATAARIVWSGGEPLATSGGSAVTTTGGTLKFFASAYQNRLQDFANIRIYSCKIRRSGNLIHNLVPCLDEFGNPTLADAVLGTRMKISRGGTFRSSGYLAVEPVAPRRFKAQPVTPRPRVWKDGALLRSGVDYDISWSNNAAPGVAAVWIVGKGAQAGLSARQTFAIAPAGCQPVEYIYGDGVSSYFDTGYTPNPQLDAMEFEVSTDDPNRNQTIFSARTSSGGNSWTLFFNGNNYVPSAGYDGGNIRYDYLTSYALTGPQVPANTRVTFRVDNEFFGWSHGVGCTPTRNAGFTATGGTLTLYAAHHTSGVGGTLGYSTYRLYGVKIRRGLDITHWFLPVTDSDGNPTLVDIVASPVTITRHNAFTAGLNCRMGNGLMVIFR